ncbi:BnaC04g18860D [Brassica napus]|uniref:Uncharacterized protein n=2 Tax=Brassica TaxID=3705 RepID=A0A3P6CMI9_BRAOL|nr:unnamed protein product [Brassica napus]CDY27306.1 BnaC04g18860D [Brassica napus]VDD08709.1 unnamed protein product [Brassica oleracea]
MSVNRNTSAADKTSNPPPLSLVDYSDDEEQATPQQSQTFLRRAMSYSAAGLGKPGSVSSATVSLYQILVLSVTLDEWSDEEVDSMIQIGGNASANSIYEAFIPDGFSKPGPDATHDLRFIREVLL